MNNRERGFKAGGVYPTQDTLRMETARENMRKYGKKERGHASGKLPNKA